VESSDRRSVFSNYAPALESGAGARPANPAPTARIGAAETPAPLAIQSAAARAFLCRFLARAFQYPDPEGWAWLCLPKIQALLRAAATTVLSGGKDSSFLLSLEALLSHLQPKGLEAYKLEYIATFGHAARGGCPMNEIEYGDLKADPLFQPHRLADLAAFYRAFGLEMADEACERQDHICLEFEFLSVLAAKEAYLREHLGRWTPAFTRRLARGAPGALLEALANFTRELVELECQRHGFVPGSEDLVLRPVDEAGESLCSTCGLASLPPGALRAEEAPPP
jgi:TorA maturation chaperone TorD